MEPGLYFVVRIRSWSLLALSTRPSGKRKMVKTCTPQALFPSIAYTEAASSAAVRSALCAFKFPFGYRCPERTSSCAVRLLLYNPCLQGRR